MNRSQQRELIELWLTAAEGAATDVQIARLNQWIETDADARTCVLSIAKQQGWLAWNASEVQLPSALATIASKAEAAESPFSAPAMHARRKRPLVWAAIAASILSFAAGIWLSRHRDANLAQADGASVQATMVSSTGCIWGPGNSGSSLLSRGASGGDSLQLLEGIAEFRVDASDVRVQMEGPASVVLTAQGAASMNYGKVIIKAGRLPGAAYAVETSFGRVLLEPESEIGLIAFGSKAEIHCFRGRAAVESPWLRSNETDVANVALEAGEALEFTDVGGATIKSNRAVAQQDRFTPQVSMNSDFLAVTSDYVREIVAAQPVAYWRFEESAAGVIRNEMGATYQGHVKGQVGWAGPEGNRAVELGMNNRQGSIVADESWDSILGGDFTIELWMKPSHHHLGSMVGFVGEFDPVVHRNKHGVLLETCGPSGPSDWLRVNQLRFLHRSQLTADPHDGASCFSSQSYEPRRWQHVVAVKEGGELRLYVDGQLMQSAHDELPTPKGLHMVIGQLYTETVERFFIGQLDEVAIYGRALSSEEVAAHHDLLRPAVKERIDDSPQANQDHCSPVEKVALLELTQLIGTSSAIQEVEHASF
jgi:hypothetical protein